MDTILVEEDTPIIVGLAKTLIPNHGIISADTITYKMKTGSSDSRIYLENMAVADIELIYFKPDTCLDIVLEYKNRCYRINNLYLFSETIIVKEQRIFCDLFFDNKISSDKNGENLVIEEIPQIKWQEKPLLNIHEPVSNMEISAFTHKQFFKRSSIIGVNPLYKEEEAQKIEPDISREIHIHSGTELVGILKTEHAHYDMDMPG